MYVLSTVIGCLLTDIDAASDDFHVFVLTNDSVDSIVCLLEMVVWIATVWHVRAEHCYRLSVDRYRCCLR